MPGAGVLLRVAASDQGVLQRAAGADSLLLVELPMERLPEDVPRLKADWTNTGDDQVKAGLQAFPRAWTASIENSSRYLRRLVRMFSQMFTATE